MSVLSRKGHKASKQAFEAGDFRSVDSVSNIERLKNLCDIILTRDEEKTLDSLRKKRNKIEHFKIKESMESVEAIMFDSLSVILNFIAKFTDLSSISEDESELLDNIKKETLKLEKVITGREEIIEASTKSKGIFGLLLVCPECKKKYFYREGDGGENKCLFCYYSDTAENIADAYISNVLNLSSYYCYSKGEEYPLYECFECGENSLVFDRNKNIGFCFHCDYTIDNLSNVGSCSNCGSLYVSRRDDGLLICSGCIENKLY